MQESSQYKDMDFNKIDPNLPNSILLDYCEKAAINCFDVTPDISYAAASSEKPLYIKRDTHWNIRGNLVAAKAESKFLEKMVCSRGN